MERERRGRNEPSEISSHLPEGVAIEILKRLPVKDLVRFTGVSKRWYTLITSQFFISLYRHETRARNNDIVLVRGYTYNSKKEHYLVPFDDDNAFGELKRLHCPLPNRFVRVVGCVNGVVCLSDDDFNGQTIILWNPSIRKSVILPGPLVTYQSHGSFKHNVGFGFDSATNDYKVVRAVSPEYETDEEDDTEDDETDDDDDEIDEDDETSEEDGTDEGDETDESDEEYGTDEEDYTDEKDETEEKIPPVSETGETEEEYETAEEATSADEEGETTEEDETDEDTPSMVEEGETNEDDETDGEDDETDGEGETDEEDETSEEDVTHVEIPPVVEIYELSTGSWRIVDSNGFPYAVDDRSPQAYLNGVVHWMGGSYKMVVSFDIASEVFGRVEVPNSLVGKLSYLNCRITVLEETLSLVHLSTRQGKSSIWVMEQYGVHDSWTKRFSFDPPEHLLDAFYIMNGGVLFQEVTGSYYSELGYTKLVCYSPKGTQLKYLGMLGSEDSFYVDNFVETLEFLSIKGRSAKQAKTEAEPEDKADEEGKTAKHAKSL